MPVSREKTNAWIRSAGSKSAEPEIGLKVPIASAWRNLLSSPQIDEAVTKY